MDKKKIFKDKGYSEMDEETLLYDLHRCPKCFKKLKRTNKMKGSNIEYCPVHKDIRY